MQNQNIDNYPVVPPHTTVRETSKIIMSLYLCFVAVFLLLFTSASIAQQSERPNILLIVAITSKV